MNLDETVCVISDSRSTSSSSQSYPDVIVGMGGASQSASLLEFHAGKV